jgi:hypothetical protein
VTTSLRVRGTDGAHCKKRHATGDGDEREAPFGGKRRRGARPLSASGLIVRTAPLDEGARGARRCSATSSERYSSAPFRHGGGTKPRARVWPRRSTSHTGGKRRGRVTDGQRTEPPAGNDNFVQIAPSGEPSPSGLTRLASAPVPPPLPEAEWPSDAVSVLLLRHVRHAACWGE